MKSEILYKPSYAMIKIDMAAGDNVDVEAGSMVAMSTGLKMKTSIGGNRSGFFGKLWAFFSALFRKIFGGETMFINRYSPPDGQDGTLYVAPSLNGDIIEYTLDGSRSLLVQSSSYLASSGDVTVKTKWGGIKSLFSGEGAFWLLISGTGTLWVNSYGAIQEIDVSGEYVVDTGHVVAFDSGLTYKITRAGGWKATLLSGEGIVMRFSGHGKLYIQTRNLGALVRWLIPYLP